MLSNNSNYTKTSTLTTEPTGGMKQHHYILPNDNPAEDTLLLGGRRFLTAKQLAALIGKHVKWLERLRLEGGGPAFRYFGKTPMYEEHDILTWLAGIPLIKNTSQLTS